MMATATTTPQPQRGRLCGGDGHHPHCNGDDGAGTLSSHSGDDDDNRITTSADTSIFIIIHCCTVATVQT